MRYLLPLLCLVTCLACGDDSVTESQPPEPDYFPYSVGSSWTYVWRDSTGGLEADSLFVSAITDTVVGGNKAVKLLFEEQHSGPGSDDGTSETVRVYYSVVVFEGDWVVFYGEDGLPTFTRYQIPLVEGATWDLEDPESPWHITYEVLGPANVSVPAGEFANCVPIRTTEHEIDGPEVDTEYLVDGIGIVMDQGQENGSGRVLVDYHIE
jgi:hypothetical protein